jgi:hypothetical protein
LLYEVFIHKNNSIELSLRQLYKPLRSMDFPLFTSKETRDFINKYLQKDMPIPYVPRENIEKKWDSFYREYMHDKVDRNYVFEYITENFNINNSYSFHISKTLYWKRIADHVKFIGGFKCRFKYNHDSTNLQAHHCTYDIAGWEIYHLEDLICLCQACHDTLHGHENQKKGFKSNLHHEEMENAMQKFENFSKIQQRNKQIDEVVEHIDLICKKKQFVQKKKKTKRRKKTVRKNEIMVTTVPAIHKPKAVKKRWKRRTRKKKIEIKTMK